MFNTVRRMTDTNLTILPLSKVTFRVGYSQNIFQGPSLSPGRSIGKYDLLLAEYQRNSTDDFLGAIDWKPLSRPRSPLKSRSTTTRRTPTSPRSRRQFNVQEADGTPGLAGQLGRHGLALHHRRLQHGEHGQRLHQRHQLHHPSRRRRRRRPADRQSGLRCDDELPALAADARPLSHGDASVPELQHQEHRHQRRLPLHHLEQQPAPITTRTFRAWMERFAIATFTGNAVAQRRMVSSTMASPGRRPRRSASPTRSTSPIFTSQAMRTSLPGITQNTPTTAGNETINYAGRCSRAPTFTISGNPSGVPLYAYFGQKFLTNNATVSWDASSRATLSLTYRYRTHTVVQTSGTGPAPANLIGIDENGGIFNAAYRPTSQWKMNGTVEMLYDDNALTPVGPRQTKHYRFHTTYKPSPGRRCRAPSTTWSGTTTPTTPASPGGRTAGHVDHSRNVSLGIVLAPSEHYGFDVNYAYSDIYTSTNICYLSGATATLCPAPPPPRARAHPICARHGAHGLGADQGLYGCADAVCVRGR
jgi:hypothetical protein